MYFLLRIPDVWDPGRTYAKVIGPNLFRAPSAVRLKIILQPLNFLQPRCPGGPRARPRVRGRRAQPHTTPHPLTTPAPMRSHAAAPRVAAIYTMHGAAAIGLLAATRASTWGLSVQPARRARDSHQPQECYTIRMARVASRASWRIAAAKNLAAAEKFSNVQYSGF